MTLKESLEMLFVLVGMITVSFCLTFMVVFLLNYIKEKWFCHHEWEAKFMTKFTDKNGSQVIYDLKCKKCDKRKHMTIYLGKGSEL